MCKRQFADINTFMTNYRESKNMEILNTVKSWAASLAEVGVSIAALMIVLEVLGIGMIPFIPATSVVANVTAMLATLGAQGIMGLVAIWILWNIWERR